jgi:hypothetical protein
MIINLNIKQSNPKSERNHSVMKITTRKIQTYCIYDYGILCLLKYTYNVGSAVREHATLWFILCVLYAEHYIIYIHAVNPTTGKM